MTIEIINDMGVWDAFVDSSPNGTLFHKWCFLRIIEKHTGSTLIPYGIFVDGSLRCIFPLYLRHEFGIKVAYSAPPAANLPYLGFITDSSYEAMGQAEKEAFMHRIADEIDECVSATRANYTCIHTVPEVQDDRPFHRDGYRTEVGFDYYMDLTRPIDKIWDSFSKECKRDIKHQEKQGLEIKQSFDVDTFYKRMRDRFTSLGLHTFYHKDHLAYIQEAVNAFPDNLQLLYLYHEGKVEGAAINYIYNGRYLLWMGAAGGKFNDYLVWELVRTAKDCGAIQIQLPGADTKRLTMFKSKFDPSLETVYAFSKADTIGELARNSLKAIKHAKSVKEAILA